MEWHGLILEARTRSGRSQRELAKQVGVTQPFLSKLEKGKIQSSSKLGQIIEALNLNRNDFPPEAFLPTTEDLLRTPFVGPIRAGHTQERILSEELASRGLVKSHNRVPVPEFARDPAYWAAAAGLIGDVPLYGAAEGGTGSLVIERDPIGTVKRIPALQGVRDGYAMYLVGESMIPEFEPGDVAYINPKKPILSNTSCLFFSSFEDEPRVMVKRFLSSDEESWKVKQFSPEETFSLDKKTWPTRHCIVAKQFRG